MKFLRMCALCAALCFLVPASYAFADEAAIHQVQIQARLSEAGDAELTEWWDVVAASGTEWYLSMNDMQGMEISDLSVSDETGRVYTYLDAWDTSRSLEEKAGTCGIVQKGGGDYELCWGVGSYGRHQFTVTYTLSGLVKHYPDATGFHHTFLSKGLSSQVEQASVTITYPGHTLQEDSARIWAFGYDGPIHFVQGSIVAQSSSALTTRQGITILAEFDPDLFPGASTGTGTFESIRTEALEGSDYGSGEGPGPAVWGVLGGVAALGIFGAAYVVLRSSLPDVYYRRTYGTTRSDMKKTALEGDQLPLEGEISKTVAVLSFLGDPPAAVSLFNAYLLKWIREKAITEAYEQQNDKTLVGIQFTHSAYGEDSLEEELYGMLVSASNQGELKNREIEQWAEHMHTKINAWYRAYLKQASEAMREEDVILRVRERRAFVSATVEVFDEKGWRWAAQVYGFKNYLMRQGGGQSGEIDNERWYDYLAYADLFGIYSRVETWHDNSYAEPFPYGYYYLGRSFRNAYQAGVSRSDGGGGSASSGGGGGASGGGGGGSR